MVSVHPLKNFSISLLILLSLSGNLKADGGSWTSYYDLGEYNVSQVTVSGTDVFVKAVSVSDENRIRLGRFDRETDILQWYDLSDPPYIMQKSEDGNFEFWGCGVFTGIHATLYHIYKYNADNNLFSIKQTVSDFLPYLRDPYGHWFGKFMMRPHPSFDSGILFLIGNEIMQPEDKIWMPVVITTDDIVWVVKNYRVVFEDLDTVLNSDWRSENHTTITWTETPIEGAISEGSEGPDGSMYFGGRETGIWWYKDGLAEKVIDGGISETATITDFWYGSGILWVAISKMIARFDGASWESFPSPDGATITDIDVDGDLVFTGTESGLYCFRYGDMSGDITIGGPKENVNVPSFSTFQTSDKIVSSPAVDNNGTIYFGNSDSTVYALNPDMTVNWSTQVFAPVLSSPAVSDNGAIYIGNANTLCKILDIGVLAWKQTIESVNITEFMSGRWFDSSPSIGKNGDIYVGNSGEYGRSVSRFDEYSNLVWHQQTNGYVISSPAINGNNTIIYGASSNGYDGGFIDYQDKSIHSYTQDGIDLPWDISIGEDIYASPALGSNSIIYIGSDDGYMRAIGATGAKIWSFRTGHNIQSSAAVAADGTIYFGCHDQYFYALNPDGTLKWSYNTGEVIFSSPAIDSNGIIYFGVMDGFVYALNPDGTLKWRYKTGGPVMSSPVITPDGTMYIGSDDGVMYAFETGSQGLQAGAYWPCFKHDAARTGRSPVKSEKYKIVGRVFDGDSPKQNIKVVYLSAANKISEIFTSSDGWFTIPNMNPGTYTLSLYNYFQGGQDLDYFSYQISATLLDHDVSVGNIDVSDFPIKKYLLRYKGDGSNRNVVYDGNFYFMSGINFDNRSLQAYNDNLEPLWSFDFGSSNLYHQIAIGPDKIIYASTTEVLYAIYPDGRQKWKIDTDGNYQFAVGADGMLYASCQDNKLRFIDPVDGSSVFEKDTAGWYQHPPVIGLDGTIHIIEGTGLVGTYSDSGTQLWTGQIEEPEPYMALNSLGDLFVYGKSTGITAFDKDGNLMWHELDFNNDLTTAKIAIDRDNTIYVNLEEYLIAMTRDWIHKWEVRVPAPYTASNINAVTLGENAIYAVMDNAYVMAVDYDGNVIWVRRAGKGYAPVKPIIMGDGLALFGDYTYLMTVNVGEPGYQESAPWPYANHDPRNTYNIAEPVMTVVEESKSLPDAFITSSVFPNPFNPSTTITYSLPHATDVTLSVYNASGQRVSVLKDDYQQAGSYSSTWNAAGYPSGLYFAVIEAGGMRESRKMMLVK